jgi:KDO2-lipid IV(A) lauroyltransferase
MENEDDSLIERFIYRLMRITIGLMSYIPFRVAQELGKMTGLFAYFIPISRKRVAYENIRASFGGDLTEADVRKLLRKVYMHFGQMLFEVPHVLRLNSRNFNRYMTIQGEENLRRARKRGKGVLFLTAHLGNWELMSAVGSLYFGNTTLVPRRSDSAAVDRVINELRTRFGAEIIVAQGAMRSLIMALKRNMMLGIFLDQNVDWYEGVFIPFFGRRACTNKGLALMARKTGAPVVPVFTVRESNGRHRIIFEKEVELRKTKDKIRDVEDNTALFTEVIERYVRKHPDQWLWFHRRWKTKNSWPWPRS